MIELININKYFNKGRPNQIHAIDNVSLSFASTGLIAIHGASGSGKTTLLNAIGGLDKVQGTIKYDKETIKEYRARQFDRVRNQYVGYIFQNYHLLEDLSVYENISLALNMAGVYDRNLINERIDQVLDAMGMKGFKKRPAKALSGGQQQRVAIARALVKSPKVIIADEPTGNLDSANTIEIMNIIKKISTKCLVILVTHEQSLVDFYADRVIEVQDGKVIKDYLNSASGSLKQKDDRIIYLQDMLNDKTSIGNINIDYFYDEGEKPNLDLSFIFRSGTLYIKNSKVNKVKLIGENDKDVIIRNEKYQEMTTEDILKKDFVLQDLPEVKRNNNRGVIRFRDALKKGLQSFMAARKLKKFLCLGFLVVAMVTVYNIATFGATVRIDETLIHDTDKNIVGVVNGEKKGAKVLTYENAKQIVAGNSDILAIMPFNYSLKMAMVSNATYQSSVSKINIDYGAYPIATTYANYALTLGRMPQTYNEVTIDEFYAAKIIDTAGAKELKIESNTELLGQYLTPTSFNSSIGKFKIVGITKTSSPIAIFLPEVVNSLAMSSSGDNYNTFYVGYSDEYVAKEIVSSKYSIVGGSDIVTDKDILVDSDIYNFSEILNYTKKIQGINYQIVGTYKWKDSSSNSAIIATNKGLEEAALVKTISEKGHTFFYAMNADSAATSLKEEKYDSYNWYKNEYDTAVTTRNKSIANKLTFFGVIFIATLVYVFFMMRASMMGRIKEIGIYRCLGAKKKDIYKIFVGEILAVSLFTTIPGYLAMTYLVTKIQNAVSGVTTIFYFPFYLFIGGLVVLVGINVLFGLIPIIILLTKTPAQIISQYDI